MANSVNQSPMRLLAVIVLYKMKPSESVTLRTLQASISGLPEGNADVRILVYDNTPGGQDPGDLPPGVEYAADVENTGLARAYNYATEIALKEGIDWLLTLDQDTQLPIDFVHDLCHVARYVAPFNSIGAILPCISDDGQVISPFILRKNLALLKRFPAGFVGVSLGNTIAANSASAIRVSALKAIGGYDPRFHFDASDWVLFQRLNRNNFHAFIAGHIQVEHCLSVLDLDNRTTPERYAAMLRAEEAFCIEYMGRLESVIILFKIFYRLIYKIWATGGSLPFFMVGLRFLCRRIFCSRKKRLESWEQSIRQNSVV